MTFSIASIVEGDGEVAALPVLLRRLAIEIAPERDVHVLRPVRVRAQRFVNNADDFARYIELAAREIGTEGAILILLDCDDGCPAKLGPTLSARSALIRPDIEKAVVFAHREFESWFLHGAQSLAGCRGLRQDLLPPAEPDSIRDAKGWLADHMDVGGYNPVAHQAAFAANLDFSEALQSNSFDKLYRDVGSMLR